MKKKTLSLILLFFICGLTAFPQSSQMTLPECIQYAERNNPTLQSAGLDVDVAEIRLKQTRLQMAPVVSASAGQNFGYSHGSEQFTIGGNYSVNAGIDIFLTRPQLLTDLRQATDTDNTAGGLTTRLTFAPADTQQLLQRVDRMDFYRAMTILKGEPYHHE